MNHTTRTEFLSHKPVRSAAEAVPPAGPLDIDQLAHEILSRDPGDAIVPELRMAYDFLIAASGRIRRGDLPGARNMLAVIQLECRSVQRLLEARSMRGEGQPS